MSDRHYDYYKGTLIVVVVCFFVTWFVLFTHSYLTTGRLDRIEARLPASTTSTTATTVPPPVPTTGSTASLPDEASSTVLPVERPRSVEPGAGCSQVDEAGACQEWYGADGPDRPCPVSDVAPNGECGASDTMACQDAPYGTREEPCGG